MRAVLGVLLEHPDQEIFGLEVVKATGLEPGTVSPILQRLRVPVSLSIVGNPLRSPNARAGHRADSTG